MADAPAATGSHASKLGFLSRKIGPVPIWLIALGILAAYFWYEHWGPGAAANSASAAADAGTDPDTGELYSSELAAAEQQIQDLQTQTDSTSTTTTTGTTPPPVTPPPSVPPVVTPTPPVTVPPNQPPVTTLPNQPDPTKKKTAKTREVTANGKEDLNKIAVDNGTTEGEVVKLNPGLKKWVGTNKDLPKGTKVKVPVDDGETVPGRKPASVAAGTSRWRTAA